MAKIQQFGRVSLSRNYDFLGFAQQLRRVSSFLLSQFGSVLRAKTTGSSIELSSGSAEFRHAHFCSQVDES